MLGTKSKSLIALLVLVVLALVGSTLFVRDDRAGPDAADGGGGFVGDPARGTPGDTEASGERVTARTDRSRERRRLRDAADAVGATGPGTATAKLPERAPGRVAGGVFGPDGKPVAGATVQIWTARAPGDFAPPSETVDRPTGVGGEFVADDLEGEEYVIQVVAPGLVTTRMHMKPARP